MDDSKLYPVLQDGDTVYSVKQWSEAVGSKLNNGTVKYKPTIGSVSAPNYTSTAATSGAVLTTSEVIFKANDSGSCWVDLSGMCMVSVANYNVTVLCQIRTGAQGGGTQVHQSNVSAMEPALCYSTVWTQCRARYLVTGLTPGTTYYARLMVSADYANARVNYGNLRIEY